MNNIIIYIVIINIISFILMGWDKHLAIQKKWRISENCLIGSAFIGGSIGLLMGMIFFHHKTKKLKFKILVPLSIVINIIIFSKYL